MANSIIKGTGGEIVGTNYNPALGNNGHEETISVLFLPKGTWLLIATGYSPIQPTDGGHAIVSQATTLSFQKNSGGAYVNGYGMVSLTYAFSLVGVCNTDSDIRVDLVATNWESYSMAQAGTSYTFKGIRIA